MRIAYVVPSLKQPSGWRTLSIRLIQALRAHVEPVVIVPAVDAETARAAFPGITVYELPATQEADLSSIAGARRLMSCWQALRRLRLPDVDLVHALEAYPTGLVAYLLARRLKCPLALTAAGTYGVVWVRHPLDSVLYRKVLRSSSLICPISDGTRRRMERYFGPDMAHSLVRTILIGTHATANVSQEEALRRTFPAEPMLLSAGDLKPRKGQLTSLQAFALLRQRFPKGRYVFVGRYQPDQPYVRQMREFIDANGLSDFVSLLDAVSDEELQALYRNASVFVLTPEEKDLHFEGFGLVYLEAGAYGLPVVATRSGGVPDAVYDGETGLLAEPGDVSGIATALEQMLSNPEIMHRMGQANRRLAETLTWERCAAEQAAAYAEVLK